MSADENMGLAAEADFLKGQIAALPPEAKLTRLSLEARLRAVLGQQAAAASSAGPGRIQLTFAGEPVERSRSIEAQFGGKAVQLFAEAVALTAASFSAADLKPGGPVPGPRDRRLRIVGAALGSFGFDLELPPPDPVLPGLPPVRDNEVEAVDATMSLLEHALLGDEDALSDVLSLVDLRAARKLGEFVKLTVDRRALFTLRFGGRRLAVADQEAARRAAAALRIDDVKQQTVTLRATLTGLRAAKPDFECIRESDGAVFLGGIERSADLEQLRSLVNKTALFRFRETTVRESKPRYVLLGVDEHAAGPGGAAGSR